LVAVEPNVINLHGDGVIGVVVLPAGLPLGSSIIELIDGAGAVVRPRLSGVVVGPVASSAPDSDVHDQVERLIKRSIVWATLPRIIVVGSVPPTAVPEALRASVNIQNDAPINIGGDPVGGVVNRVHMEGIRVAAGIALHGLGGKGVPILGEVWTPVEGAADVITTLKSGGGSIPAGLHDVDLSRRGPFTIGVGGGQHPDSRPEPVTLGNLSTDLNSPILDVEGVDSADTGRPNGIKVVATVSGDTLAAPESVSSAHVVGRGAPQVHPITIAHVRLPIRSAVSSGFR